MADLSKPHPVEGSAVGQALVDLLAIASPAPPGENPCTAMYSQCPIAPGIEDLFRSQLAHTVVSHLSGAKERAVPFHEVVYAPHATKENGGFDLSFGQFNLEPRIRTMQKLINLKYKVWCDQPWGWSTDDDRTALAQLCSLIETFANPENKRLHEPFLVINVCFCLHEFRRMGKPGIPDFEDQRRTVIVDLRSVADCADFTDSLESITDLVKSLSDKSKKDQRPQLNEKLKSFNTRLTVSFDPARSDPRVAEFECNGKKIPPLPIWTLKKFQSHIGSIIP